MTLSDASKHGVDVYTRVFGILFNSKPVVSVF